MVRVAALLCLVVLAVTACGSSHAKTAKTATSARVCREARVALQRISADIATLQGAAHGAATDRATDRFLLDVTTAPISNLQRNRLIDHAAAAVATKCPQCFQALEAERPIPAIAHGDTGCGG